MWKYDIVRKQSFSLIKDSRLFINYKTNAGKTYLMGESAFRSDKGGEQHG